MKAWLLADRDGIAGSLRVAPDRVLAAPEELPNPNHAMVTIAARSRDSSVRHDMVPRPGAGRDEGHAHASRLQEFARNESDVTAAEETAPSLRGCIAALGSLRTV